MLLSWVEKEIGNAILMISRMSSPNTAEPPFSYDDEEKAKKVDICFDAVTAFPS